VLEHRSVDAETTVSGNEFQICEVATGKARPPMVESLKWGTSRWSVLAEWSARRPGMSATRVSGPRYHSNTSRGMIWVTLNMKARVLQTIMSWNFTLSGEWSPWFLCKISANPFRGFRGDASQTDRQTQTANLIAAPHSNGREVYNQ